MRHPHNPHRECADGFGADALLESDIHFMDFMEPVITDWGEILPPMDFSQRQFEALSRLATEPAPDLFRYEATTEAAILAKRLVGRPVVFDEDYGCWQLPLTAEYDSKNRARYPQLTIPQLNISNYGAHRATMRFIRQVDVEGMSVDHLCRRHACCNPYHGEAVTHGENTVRGRDSRGHEVGKFTLGHVDVGITYGELRQLVGVG